MEFTAENVESAVGQFYRGVPGSQTEINCWLTLAQISQQAWTFSWQLLQPGKSPEVQFFGANSLHMKIARFWHELPQDRVLPLRTELIQLVLNFATGPRMVLTRLCVTLSSFLLQTMPELWSDAVPSLVTAFGPSSLSHLQPEQADAVLFEILTVLPEEFITSHLLPHRKGPVRNELQKALDTVVPLLQRYMSSPSSGADSPPRQREQALRCLRSWAQFGLPLPAAEPLMGLVLQALRTPQTFEPAVEAAVPFFQHADNHRFPQCMQRLLAQITQLEDLLQAAIAERDMERCPGLCKLTVMAADHNIGLLLACSLGDDQQRTLASRIVGMMLQCTGMPGYYPVDECCSDFPFGFWYNFQDEILNAEPEQHRLLMQIYAPVFMHFVDVLLRKVQYPPENEYNSWDADEREQHRCYRQDIADSLMYVYNLLQQPLLSSLCHCLESVLDRAATQPVPWQEIETVLFALTSLAEGINSEDISHLAATFTLLPRIQSTNYTLVSQALYFIGAFSEWLADHPAMLGCALPLLLQGLRDRELVLAATLSLKEVLRENQVHLGPFVNDILTAIKEVVSRASWGTKNFLAAQSAPDQMKLFVLPLSATLDSRILKPSDEARLYWCLGYVLSVLPFSDILAFLSVVLAPIVDQMRTLASEPPTAATRQSISEKLGVLAFLFCSLNVDYEKEEPPEEGEGGESEGGGIDGDMRAGSEKAGGDGESRSLTGSTEKEKRPQPVLYILQQVMPVLQLVLQTSAADGAIVTGVCDVMKHALRTLMSDFAPLLADTASLLLQAYQLAMQPALLDLAKQLLVLFVGEPEWRDLCQKLFTALCNHTLRCFDTGRQKELTDVMEALMSFLAQITKKSVGLLKDKSCNLAGLYHSAVIGLLMHESPTSKASCQFLSVFIGLGPEVIEVQEILNSQGQAVVVALMKAIGGEAPRNNVDPMVDVLLALSKHHFALLCALMNDIVAQDAFPGPHVRREDKEMFARRILSERTNKRKLKEVVQEYTLLWRGLINTEYATQTRGGMTFR